MTIRSRLVKLLVGESPDSLRGQIERLQLAVKALDDAHDRMWSRSSTEGTRDRYQYDRTKTLADALEAWRTNPIAKRIISLATDYVVGGDLSIGSTHKPTNDFLQDWWTQRLNHMLIRSADWCGWPGWR